MTVVVAIKCCDGAVIASDSMITVGSAQQTGQKIHVLAGPPQQLFAFSGDLGLAERFRAVATVSAGTLPVAQHKLDYATNLGAGLANNLKATSLDPLKVPLETVLAFTKDDVPEVCLFGLGSQPRFLDQDHYNCAIGSGAVAATPFLKFLTDTLLEDRQPSLAEGKLLAAWGVKYAINTMAGGVGLPIDLATIEKGVNGEWQLRELERQDVEETLQAIQSASEVLKTWRGQLSAGENTEEIPEP